MVVQNFACLILKQKRYELIIILVVPNSYFLKALTNKREIS